MSCSTMRAVSSGPALTARRPGMASTSSATLALSDFFSPQIRTSSSRSAFAVGQLGRADRVEGGDDRDAFGDHLLRLLGGGALPDAERAGRLARDGGRERHGAVDEELPGLERVLQVREVLGLRPERHGEDRRRDPAWRPRRSPCPRSRRRERRRRASSLPPPPDPRRAIRAPPRGRRAPSGAPGRSQGRRCRR